MAKDAKQIDAAFNVALNPVSHDGFTKPWGDVFERLSDEGMRLVRERRAARDEQSEAAA